MEPIKLFIGYHEGDITRNGRLYHRIRWKEENKQINLGSIQKPNKGIKQFKYLSKSDYRFRGSFK